MRFSHGSVICELDNLPGCDQIVVSHNVWMPEQLRGEGRGEAAMASRLQQIRNLGYDYAMCTVARSNRAERKILEKNGFRKLDYFKSSKTGNTVEIWGKVMRENAGYDPDSVEYQRYSEWEKMWEKQK